MSATPNPKVRQCQWSRKSHDSDMLILLVRIWRGQNTGGALAVIPTGKYRVAGGDIPPPLCTVKNTPR